MISGTTIGILLYTIPFCILAFHSFGRYLNDKQNPQKKHIFYAFVSVSIGFMLNSIGALLVSPDMSTNQRMVVSALTTLFDAFNMIGVFWFFVFLTDFIERMKKYILFVAVHLAVTLIVILVTPADVIVLDAEHIRERSDVHSAAILFFWFLYFGMIAYQFWKYSGLMTKKTAIRRAQMMSAGALFAVFAYIFVIAAQVSQDAVLVYLAESCAVASGIVFYAGFVAPERLRRMLEK